MFGQAVIFLKTCLDKITAGKIILFGKSRSARVMAGQNYFLPGPSDPSFYSFIIQTRNMSSVSFQMLMTPTLDPATDTNSVAKRWRQDHLLPLQARKQDNLLPLQAWRQDSLLRSLRFRVWKAAKAAGATVQMTTTERGK